MGVRSTVFAHLAFVAAAVTQPNAECRICYATGGGVTDQWCQENCNANQPFCPDSMCSCDAAPPTPPKPDYVGYYSPSWDKGSIGPTGGGATFGVAFTGWVDPDKALSEYQGPRLQGAKHVSFGGGNANGRFTASRISGVVSAIESGRVKEAGFEAVCFDVEECDAGLSSHFASAFAAAKAQGLGVWVTTSHSAPYGCSDGADLVQGWLQDSNLDFISPQLYTSGAETCADFEPNEQLPWSAWKSSVSKIVPSLPDASHYPLAYQWFKKHGLQLPVGFVQWSEVHAFDSFEV